MVVSFLPQISSSNQVKFSVRLLTTVTWLLLFGFRSLNILKRRVYALSQRQTPSYPFRSDDTCEKENLIWSYSSVCPIGDLWCSIRRLGVRFCQRISIQTGLCRADESCLTSGSHEVRLWIAGFFSQRNSCHCGRARSSCQLHPMHDGGKH